jgi:hypothetical protein
MARKRNNMTGTQFPGQNPHHVGRRAGGARRAQAPHLIWEESPLPDFGPLPHFFMRDLLWWIRAAKGVDTAGAGNFGQVVRAEVEDRTRRRLPRSVAIKVQLEKLKKEELKVDPPFSLSIPCAMRHAKPSSTYLLSRLSFCLVLHRDVLRTPL